MGIVDIATMELTALFGTAHAKLYAQQIVEQAKPDVTILVGQAWHQEDAVCLEKPTDQLDELLENSAKQKVLLVWSMVCVLDERWQEVLHRYANVHQIVIAASASLRGALVWQAGLVAVFGLANQPNQPNQLDQNKPHLGCLFHHRFKFDMDWPAFCNQVSNLAPHQFLLSFKPANQI